MERKLTPAFIALTQDACLKAFWRKKALRRFLQQEGVPKSFLATWHEDQSKREFLEVLFDDLIACVSKDGHRTIEAFARSLAQMRFFPDLEGWEDSKEKISAAHKAVERIRDLVAKLDQQLVNEEEHARRIAEARTKRQAAIEATQTLHRLEMALTVLTKKQGSPEGGYEFEAWFYELVQFFEIQARKPYRSGGRQIDGSLTLDGTTFLIETKFGRSPTETRDVDSFMARITRKADNTMGILVSMSGFTKVAVAEASRDRTPMFLMDYGHFFSLVLSRRMTLQEVIRRMKRHASQTGEAFLPASCF